MLFCDSSPIILGQISFKIQKLMLVTLTETCNSLGKRFQPWNCCSGYCNSGICYGNPRIGWNVVWSVNPRSGGTFGYVFRVYYGV